LSKSGFKTKFRLIADAHGLPVRAELTGGEVSHNKGLIFWLTMNCSTQKWRYPTEGYDSDHIRNTVSSRGGTPVIPGKTNRKVPIQVDSITYALRNRIERCFNKLKCSRRFATRYDKTAACYLGFIHITAARLWVKSLST
jgi:transposase